MRVLESKVIARGSTVASTALLMQEPDRDFVDLARRFGARATREVWTALARATRDLARTIRSLKIDCDLRARDSVYFTIDPEKVSGLRKEFEARKAARLPGRWLSAAALHRMTGINAQAAIATPGNAEVNPLRACHGFLSAAVARGAKVFERSTARSIKASTAWCRGAHSGRHHCRKGRRHRDRLFPARVRALRRSIQHERHVCHCNATTSTTHSPPNSRIESDGLGHRSSLPLLPVDHRRTVAALAAPIRTITR